MSASSSDHHSSEEENTRTSRDSSPLGQIHYHPFRPSPWTPGQFETIGRAGRQTSPGGIDPPSNPVSLDSRGVDPRFFPTRGEDFSPHPPSYPSTSRPDASPIFPPHTRPVSDQSLSLGIRLDAHDMRGNPETLSGSYPGNEREYSSAASEAGSGPSFIYHGPGRWRHPYNRDEFDGPAQWLPLPLLQHNQARAQPLLSLPTSLTITEQDDIARRVNDVLSQCAFHFVARYQFPIPIDRDKPYVRQAADREWTEWAFLLKRLATKRRIPQRVLYQGQIKQLVTTLENSIAVRQTVPRTEPATPRQDRDDRYMLQLVSSGLQVAKILMDAVAMEHLDQLYLHTEAVILERRGRIGGNQTAVDSGRIARGPRGSFGRAVGSRGGGGSAGGGGGGLSGGGGSAGAGY